jgi:predicted acylesterase/phospholipase RssA
MCDIVLKGGITSGVVYPRAVGELASTYRLKSVGGTSAGAIAAAAAAAAEYGREGGAFERLNRLPDWIGNDDNLASLFQPAQRTKGLFDVVMAGVNHDRAKLLWIALAAVRASPAALGGLAPGAVLGVLAVSEGVRGPALWVMLLGATLLMLLVLATAVAVAVAVAATRRIPENDFGLCSGMPGPTAASKQALTPWLEGLIDSLAGRKVGDGTAPLTFGDLWAGPDSEVATADPEDPWLRLEMMTTNVTNRRAVRLPWAAEEFFFSGAQMRRLFPERIVRWLEDHPPPLPEQPAARRDALLLRGLLFPLRPLPHAADLPVLVATRMSLSFPVLLSAVPLWRVDWTRTANSAAGAKWRRWLQDHPAEWEAVAGDPAALAALARGRTRPQPEVCWFSDGGIGSNFPIHFFDSLVPRHPTFGINLRPFHPDHEPSAVECDNVWMVTRHWGGTADWWYRFDRSLAGFLSGMVRTMQNRVDEAQMRLPGYRDRVVHVSLTESEGGMNLTMPTETIESLTERGECAGRRLVERFAEPPKDPHDLSWNDHRWVRYRASLVALATMLRQFAEGYTHAIEPTYAALLDRGPRDHPIGYPVTEAQRKLAHELSDGLVALANSLQGAEASLLEEAPRPPPALRLVPEDPVPARKDQEPGTD